MNNLLLGKYEVNLLICKDEGKLPPLRPKLNQVDEENVFQNDAFSPLSPGSGGTIELKGSAFDDGGPSAHSSNLNLAAPVSLKRGNSVKVKSSLFGFRREGSLTSDQKHNSQLTTESSIQRSRTKASAATNKSSATESPNRSSKEIFDELNEDELIAAESVASISRKPTIQQSAKPSTVSITPL
jgi:hypothetical protein